MSTRELASALHADFDSPFKGQTGIRKYIAAQPHGPFALSAPVCAGAPAKSKPAKLPDNLPKRSAADVKAVAESENFVVTCAVNNSEVNEEFLQALERYCEERGAQLLVTPVRYKNPTTLREFEEQSEKYEYEWDSRLEPYLYNTEVRPHERLSIMPTKIQATANDPLPPRVSAMTGERSSIFGHPQVSMRTVPTPHRRHPKLMYTTGAVTVPNYSDTLTGDVGRFHHSPGAVVAEVRGDQFHLREIRWDGKQFIDFDRLYTPTGSGPAPAPSALVLGDVHVGVDNDEVLHATLWADDSLVETLRPDWLVVHDVFDGRSVNPHELHDPVKRGSARQGLVDELSAVELFLERASDMARVAVIESNHHAFLYRWLGREPQDEDRELHAYLTWQLIVAAREGRTADALKTALEYRGYLSDRIRWVGVDEPFMMHDIALNLHGDRGANGAKGTPKGFANMGVKSIIGDKHSPQIWHGVYVAGVCGLQHGYNKGPSGWMETHVILHATGKRQMAHCINGRFRGQ